MVYSRSVKLGLLAAVLSFTAPGLALGQGGPIVAVFDMEDRGSVLSTETLDKMTNYLMVLMAGGGFQVIPRDEIKNRLRSQKIESYKLCYDQMCQIELGRELAAQMSLSSFIMKIGNRCQLSAMLYDLKKAATAQGASADSKCDETSLMKAIKTLASKIRLAPEEGGVGILLVQTTPSGAVVKVDGEEVGTSPVTVKDLPAGHHEVEAIKGEVKAKQTALVKGGEVARVSLDLTGRKFFNVTIFSDPPEAQVKWDGKDLGKAPVVLKNVEQGAHKLRLSLSGYLPKEDEVTVGADQELNVKLLPQERRLRLVTRPPGAEVWVAGKSQGKSPVEVMLAAGQKHVVTALAPNYQRIGWEIEVKPAAPDAPPQKQLLVLVPEPVPVKVSVSPSDAKVVIGSGEYRSERVGPGEAKVIPGRRKIVGILDGYRSAEKEIDIPIGKPGSVELTLEPLPAFVEFKDSLSSKRWQAWSTLAASIVAAGVSWPLLKLSADSKDAADRTYTDYRRSLDRDEAISLLNESRSLDDRAMWTQVGGYSALGLAVISLGWSIYCFATMPERPESWSIAPAPATSGQGGHIVVGGSF